MGINTLSNKTKEFKGRIMSLFDPGGGGVLNFELGTEVLPEVSTTTL